MRLIDADALKKSLCAECSLNGDKCLCDKCDWDFVYHIERAPTIDAEPVVRCKDCKWFDGFGWCIFHGSGMFEADDFCTYGLRKQEDGEKDDKS